MRALMSCEPGGPGTLRLLDVPDPVAGPGQVLVAVQACGVNYPDFLTIQDRYQVKTPRPFAPGAEVAGVVAAVGEGIAGLRVGDRVAARTGTGGMAEFVAVDAARCSPIPDGMPFVDAAVMQFTFETAYYALHTRAGVRAGETVLVLGAAGGVGVAAVQVARNLGARVIAAASSEEKLDFVRRHGAAHGVLYSAATTGDGRELAARLKQAVGSHGADVIIDPAGGWLAEAAIRCIAESGRYLVLGFTAGIPSLPLNLPLLKNCDVLGINWRTFTLSQDPRVAENRRALQAWYSQGMLSSGISTEFPLQEGGAAIQRLADRRVLGKIVVVI